MINKGEGLEEDLKKYENALGQTDNLKLRKQILLEIEIIKAKLNLLD